MPTNKNRVQMTVSGTPGTGTITVNAASSGYQAFAAGDDGKKFDCVFVDGTAWEVARECTYTHSGTTVSRGTLEESSTGSAKSGTWQDLSCDNSGTCGHFRIYASDGTTCHLQGTCGTSDTDMIVDTASPTAGQSFTVSSFSLTDGNA